MNEIKDFTKAAHRLDRHADIDEGDVVTIDGTNWTGLDLRISVADHIARRYSAATGFGALRKITTGEVRAMLAAHGMSPFGIRQHARALATLARNDFARA